MLKFALRNLLSRPMRSALSLIGLTVAIMGMVGLFSVAKGLDEMVSDTFRRITGLVAMQPGSPIPLFSRLPASWQREIERVPGVRIVSPEVWSRANVIEGKAIISPPRFLFGTDIASRLKLKQGVYRDDMVAGRFLRASDRGTLNAVISRPIAEEFHKGIGDTLDVNGHQLRIVGIYYCGSLLMDIAIMMDIDEVRRVARFGNDSVSAYYIEQTGDVSDAVLSKRIQDQFNGRDLPIWRPTSARDLTGTGFPLLDLLGGMVSRIAAVWERSVGPLASEKSDQHAASGNSSGAHRINSAGSPPRSPAPAASSASSVSSIEVRGSTDFAARFEEFSADLDLFLTIMSAIGVTIAVLSIVNTMLMSVTERIIEFGILKANGWSRYDVLKLITSESAALGLAGGAFGCLVGWGATEVINSIWPARVHLVATPGLLLFGLVFSTVLGVIGGLYPALWAMRMMPMDAIRRG
jgi:putative ABC transport system permease protein